MIKQLFITTLLISNLAPIGFVTYQSDASNYIYGNAKYTPNGWHNTIESHFYPKIGKYYKVLAVEVQFGVWFNRDYGWWADNFMLLPELIGELNRQSYSRITYSANHAWHSSRLSWGLNVTIGNYTHMRDPDWGTWYSSTGIGGIAINLKLKVFNTLKKDMDDIVVQLHNKKPVEISTPNIVDGNNLTNQQRVLSYIYHLIGEKQYLWITKYHFYQNYVLLELQKTMDGHTQTRKVQFNFKYQLAGEYSNLEQLLKKLNQQVLDVKTHTYSLKENETKIKNLISTKLAREFWNHRKISSLVDSYDFRAGSLLKGHDVVDVYLNLKLPSNFKFQKDYDEQYRFKLTFKITYSLDEDYFKKTMEHRVSFESKGTKLDRLYNGYEVYSDEVLVKFRTNLSESEALYVNNQPVGVTNGLFVYLLEDGRNYTDAKKAQELNTYEIKLVKKDAIDPKNKLKDIVWTKKIMIRKKAPKLDIKLWAEDDLQNPNEIVGMVVYDPVIDNDFKVESKWLKDHESHLLGGVHGLSGSLMGIHIPTWEQDDLLINDDAISWEYKAFAFDTSQKQKLDLNFKKDQATENGFLKDRIKNQSQFFSHSGIFRFQINDALKTTATYYHINLGVNNFNKLNKTTGEQILTNIKKHLYYFWDSKLGRALINYLRGISFYVHHETKKSLTFAQYRLLSKKEQKYYHKIFVGGIGEFSATELLTMPLHVIHFNISRMIRDLQFDLDGKLEDKLKDGNEGNEGLIDEDKNNKDPDDDTDENDNTKEEDKNKEKDNWKKDQDDQIKTKAVVAKIRTSMILGTFLSCLVVVVCIGVVIYFRKRKKIR